MNVAFGGAGALISTRTAANEESPISCARRASPRGRTSNAARTSRCTLADPEEPRERRGEAPRPRGPTSTRMRRTPRAAVSCARQARPSAGDRSIAGEDLGDLEDDGESRCQQSAVDQDVLRVSRHQGIARAGPVARKHLEVRGATASRARSACVTREGPAPLVARFHGCVAVAKRRRRQREPTRRAASLSWGPLSARAAALAAAFEPALPDGASAAEARSHRLPGRSHKALPARTRRALPCGVAARRAARCLFVAAVRARAMKSPRDRGAPRRSPSCALKRPRAAPRNRVADEILDSPESGLASTAWRGHDDAGCAGARRRPAARISDARR